MGLIYVRKHLLEVSQAQRCLSIRVSHETMERRLGDSEQPSDGAHTCLVSHGLERLAGFFYNGVVVHGLGGIHI